MAINGAIHSWQVDVSALAGDYRSIYYYIVPSAGVENFHKWEGFSKFSTSFDTFTILDIVHIQCTMWLKNSSSQRISNEFLVSKVSRKCIFLESS